MPSRYSEWISGGDRHLYSLTKLLDLVQLLKQANDCLIGIDLSGQCTALAFTSRVPLKKIMAILAFTALAVGVRLSDVHFWGHYSTCLKIPFLKFSSIFKTLSFGLREFWMISSILKLGWSQNHYFNHFNWIYVI